MKLIAYALNDHPPRLIAARPHRDWMDAFPHKHAYRCLPLTIANTHGWEVLCPVPIEVTWNGGMKGEDLTVKALKPLPGNRPLDHFCRSNFTRGIVTFHTDYIFRTEPAWDLIATGPVNRPKDNAYAMTGVIETDWLPYPFTMNWQILRPGTVVFEEDEPYCCIFPVPKQALTEVEPEIRNLADDPELESQHEAFKNSRDAFMKQMRSGDVSAIRQGWQRHYFVGRHPDGAEIDGHTNKLRLQEPVDRRGEGRVAQTQARPKRRDPRWADDSLLNFLDAGQTEANAAGRARVDENGVLTPTPRTVRVSGAADAAGRDFLYVEDFFSPAECAFLRMVFGKLKDRKFTSDKIDPYWNGRFVWLKNILAAYPEAGRLMIERQRKAIGLIADFYKLSAPVYSDLLHIVQWQPGSHMPFHADNAYPGGEPHAMAYRDFSGVAYLSDDYEGGELYFSARDLAIKPKAGSFVAFTGGFHHEHAVLRVTGGNERLTLPSFFTFAAEHADPLLHPGVAAKRPVPADA